MAVLIPEDRLVVMLQKNFILLGKNKAGIHPAPVMPHQGPPDLSLVSDLGPVVMKN